MQKWGLRRLAERLASHSNDEQLQRCYINLLAVATPEVPRRLM